VALAVERPDALDRHEHCSSKATEDFMAHSRTAKKAVRQNETRRALNRWRLKAMRDAMKEFNDAILHGTAAKAKEEYLKCQKVIDRTASRGIIHKNQAARRKSRMVVKLKLKQAAPAAPAKKESAKK
jgi:small subunit ribosomal protein S20